MNAVYTLPETNIAPANRVSHKESHLPTNHFQERTVSFRGSYFPVIWGLYEILASIPMNPSVYWNVMSGFGSRCSYLFGLFFHKKIGDDEDNFDKHIGWRWVVQPATIAKIGDFLLQLHQHMSNEQKPWLVGFYRGFCYPV